MVNFNDSRILITDHELLWETERLTDRILSLPIYPELDPGQVEKVCSALRSL